MGKLKQGSIEAWKHRNLEAWKQGITRKHGNMKLQGITRTYMKSPDAHRSMEVWKHRINLNNITVFAKNYFDY